MKLRQIYRAVAVLLANGACKITLKRLRIDVWIDVKMKKL